MLQCAQGVLQKWPEGFAGRVELDLGDAGALGMWARGALATISAARTPQFFKDGDGRFPITFETRDQHPLGGAVRVHLGAESWRIYRVDASGRIRQQENAGAASRTSATYDGFIRACPGRLLPTRIHMLNWDVSTQTVVETTEIEDAYGRRQHVWLPVQRRTVVVRGERRREFSFELLDHLVF